MFLNAFELYEKKGFNTFRYEKKKNYSYIRIFLYVIH